MAVWFDAFVQNVDRTARNPNLLVWHRSLHFIDHGAALYFHHNWETAPHKTESPFPEVQHHLLLPWASAIPEASVMAHRHLNKHVLREILAMVPDAWIAWRRGFRRGCEAALTSQACLVRADDARNNSGEILLAKVASYPAARPCAVCGRGYS